MTEGESTRRKMAPRRHRS